MSEKANGESMDKFSGKPSGMSFDKFDEKVISWGRMKYCERYAKALWRNELLDLSALNLSDKLDQYKFDEHCSLVNDVISCESPQSTQHHFCLSACPSCPPTLSHVS
jgi:hypothetical protein